MNKPVRTRHTLSPATRAALVPALLAVGAMPAARAVELGEIAVHSTLGQPLRASIAFALGPNEQIADYCISLKPGRADSGLPTVSRARIGVADGVISLTGSTPIREPLLATELVIECPYTPHLARSYLLLVDPAGEPANPRAPAETVAPVVVRTPRQQVEIHTASDDAADRRPAVAPEPAPAAGARYRVRRGDSLSMIASRIDDRPVSLWAAAEAIFEANPHAFLDEDPNQLKAGSWLSIPAFVGTAVTESVSPEEPSVRQPATVTVAAPAEGDAASAGGAVTDTAPEPVEAPHWLSQASLDGPSVSDEELREALEFVTVPQVAAPVVHTPATASPRVDRHQTPPVVRPAPQPEAETSRWFDGLSGAAVVLLVGLLALGRRVRRRAVPPAAAEAHPLRRHTDGDTRPAPAAEPQFSISDDAPTEENLALDADLFEGTGLGPAREVDIAEDFGFSAATELDLELPDDRGEAESPATDIIPPPQRADVGSILESEVLPEADDYDMSVVIDVTKMPDPEDVTQKDFHAIAVDDDAADHDGYTLSHEVDYEMLEQDYEHELTATQALRLEIDEAARELARRMDLEIAASNDEGGEDETTGLHLASVTTLNVTGKFTADNDDDGPDDPVFSLTEADKTVEMPSADDEDTAEITLSTGKFDSRAG